MAVTLTINGTKRQVEGDPAKPLLWVLREDLDMVGTKFGCGAGLCGACTVHVDGNAVRSCQTLLGDVNGGAITTIEAVGQGDVGKRISDAWVKLDVPQCGYCQAGQIMSATALLTETPKPSDEEIDAAMMGNLCRCSTYVRIRAAIKEAADIKEAAAIAEVQA